MKPQCYDNAASQRTFEQRLNDGADNLIRDCVGMQSGESCLLILEKDESLYEWDVAHIIQRRCEVHAIKVEVFNEDLIDDPADFSEAVLVKMQAVQHTIFLSRLGDYARFTGMPVPCSKHTCYAYNKDLLAAPYATVSSVLLTALQKKLEGELLAATRWRITCPLGTDLSGTFCWPSLSGGDDDEILVVPFPVATFKPVPCDTANGTVAITRWLAPGGVAKLDDATLAFAGTVHCDVRDGLIQGFSGSAPIVDQVSQHYNRVASTLGIDRDRVHSWHLGINPQTVFAGSADQDFDRWCAVSFGSPRYLHVHTCGDEPPGEVTWSLFDCTVTIDDQTYWEKGEFTWLRRTDNLALIKQYPDGARLLESARPIGV